ncbi:MAG TPA: hypothetical protein DIU37_05290 [Opitutae bacterium]|nr:hypothetical protein [Opitutae bacterium]|tara:strand:- start:209 stop:1081 length:873 start_codon:yes stop_codon:yes gene_type:complete
MHDISWVLFYRTDALSTFFKCFPILGSQGFLMFTIALGYWAWNRRFFKEFVVLIAFAILLNSALKAYFMAPRPDVERLTPVATVSSYSFPSGDAQTVATYWFCLALWLRRTWFTVFSIVLVSLTAFSRIYLGMHFPEDVICGFLLGGLTAWLHMRFRPYYPSSLTLWAVLYIVSSLTFCLYMGSDLNRLHIGLIGMMAGLLLGQRAIRERSYADAPTSIQGKWMIALWGAFSLYALEKLLKVVMPMLPLDAYTEAFLSFFLITLYIIWGAPWCFDKLSCARYRSPLRSLA